MRLGIRTKQVLGVTAIVVLAEAVLFAWYAASLALLLLQDTRSNAQFLMQLVYQRTFTVVRGGGDPAAAIAGDEGLLDILKATAYAEGIDYAVIVDPAGTIIADALPDRLGKTLEAKPSLDDLIDNQGPIEQLRAIYTEGGRSFELRQPLVIGESKLDIRVGVSTLLLRSKLMPKLTAPFITAALVLVASILVAMLLAQLVLRPIHVIRSGLARLGKGELGVNVDLRGDAELAEIGQSFQQVSARLAADREELEGQKALESAVEHLEDAVALFAPDGTLLFANTAMENTIGAISGRPAVSDIWPSDHPYRVAVERAMSGEAHSTPAPLTIADQGERLVLTNLVPGAGGEPIGVVLVSRNLDYLSRVESRVSYSRKVEALNRLTEGIAHEIKNPLNATMIHLELLKMEIAAHPDALQHVSVIVDQVRRLDEVVKGFMKFTRPEKLELQAVELAAIIERVRPVIEAETVKQGIDLKIDVPPGLKIDCDPNLLEQAFLNLALNACQAMPDGGRLRVTGRAASGRLVTVEFEDTGVGIAPEHLSRIFDLYFTTKPKGSGIGLSMVFRTVQLHDGDIEVQSTPGRGTTFKIILRRA